MVYKNEYHRRYYQKNKAKVKQRNTAWKKNNPAANKVIQDRWNEKMRMARIDPKRRARFLWRGARKRNKEFSITLKYVEDLMLLAVGSACPYTKVPFDFSVGAKGVKNPWAPSLDRKDNSMGYVEGNIEVVSVWWNTAKNHWAPEVMALALAGLRA